MSLNGLSQFIIGLKGILFREHGNKPRRPIQISNLLPISVRISLYRSPRTKNYSVPFRVSDSHPDE